MDYEQIARASKRMGYSPEGIVVQIRKPMRRIAQEENAHSATHQKPKQGITFRSLVGNPPAPQRRGTK
eukprot:5818536-Pyramimonas_sp.AAC.1